MFFLNAYIKDKLSPAESISCLFEKLVPLLECPLKCITFNQQEKNLYNAFYIFCYLKLPNVLLSASVIKKITTIDILHLHFPEIIPNIHHYFS